jgi:putative membrane protein
MTILAFVAGLFGFAMLTGLAGHYGFASVFRALVSSEWGTLLVVAARAAALTGAGAGWWFVGSPKRHGPYLFVGLRFVRESINSLFPFAVVGGDVIGATLLTRFGIARNTAIAGVLIDLLLQVVCLLILVLVGLWVLCSFARASGLAGIVWVILAMALPAVAGFSVVLNFGASAGIAGWLVKLGEKRRWPAFKQVAHLGEQLQQIFQNRRGLLAAFLVHLATVFFGASEVWIAVRFMGHPISPLFAIAIESIGQGGRAVAFAIPGGLGVQEGALVAACVALGVPPEVALAMTLIKRAAELVVALPGLFAWQIIEGRRLLGLTRSVRHSKRVPLSFS